MTRCSLLLVALVHTAEIRASVPQSSGMLRTSLSTNRSETPHRVMNIPTEKNVPRNIGSMIGLVKFGPPRRPQRGGPFAGSTAVARGPGSDATHKRSGDTAPNCLIGSARRALNGGPATAGDLRPALPRLRRFSRLDHSWNGQHGPITVDATTLPHRASVLRNRPVAAARNHRNGTPSYR